MENQQKDASLSEGLTLADLGQALVALGNNLQELGALSVGDGTDWDPREELYIDSLDQADRLVYENQKNSKREGTMSQTLNGMRKFRAEYEHLERMIASYAMHQMNFPQRRTATLLGVGLGTINRLAQASAPEEN